MKRRKKIYLVYKTTNLINGKIYIGYHITYNLNDGYMGSGANFVSAFEKYGEINFKRIILEKCRSREKMERREVYWINKLNARNPDIGYNITPGGKGGVGRPVGFQHPTATKQKMARAAEERFKDQNQRDLCRRRMISFHKKHPEYAVKKSIEVIKRFKDPNERHKLSKKSKEWWNNPLNKKSHSGKNHPLWIGYVYVYNPFGKLEGRFKTINEASRKLKLNVSDAIKRTKPFQKGKFKGYIFKIKKKNK
jgi:group I intron endonuclease